MEKDFTADIAELNAHYAANRVANASIATEVRNKYRTIIEAEIRTRKAEVDKEFADHLARVKARSGMPLSVIQDHVLHTKAWSRWVYWRDLANIPPERISLANAKEVAAKTFEWIKKDGVIKVVRVLKDLAGNPVDIILTGAVDDRGAIIDLDRHNDDWPGDVAVSHELGDIQAARKIIKGILTDAWEAGEISDSDGNFIDITPDNG